MNSIFQIFINTVTAKLTSLVTKLKYWTNPAYIRSVILTNIRKFFSRLLDVRPRNKKDYFTFFHLLVSKRLVFLLVTTAGVFSLYYLAYINPPRVFTEGAGSTRRVYSYRSLPLRFYNGKVEIKARSGYTAYIGTVERGAATGWGRLYSENRNPVYEGNFLNNDFNGQGTLYYPSGGISYKGEFLENLFEGIGVSYRENGSRLYEGEFGNGLKDGEGTLYNASENKIFTGAFRGGEIVFSQLLQKSSSEIGGAYTGKKTVYTYGNSMLVALDEIGAFYAGETDSNSIENEVTAQKVLVCRDSFAYGGKSYKSVETVKRALGEPAFEGNSYLTFPEAVGIHWQNSRGKNTGLKDSLKQNALYDEVNEVLSFDAQDIVYLTVFSDGGLTYTFFGTKKGGGFFLYQIEALAQPSGQE